MKDIFAKNLLLSLKLDFYNQYVLPVQHMDARLPVLLDSHESRYSQNLCHSKGNGKSKRPNKWKRARTEIQDVVF